MGEDFKHLPIREQLLLAAHNFLVSANLLQQLSDTQFATEADLSPEERLSVHGYKAKMEDTTIVRAEMLYKNPQGEAYITARRNADDRNYQEPFAQFVVAKFVAYNPEAMTRPISGLNELHSVEFTSA